MIFDTTASDTGHMTRAACVTLQQRIGRACIILVYMPSLGCISMFLTQILMTRTLMQLKSPNVNEFSRFEVI